MTTQYTTILKLALPVQGELSGTWGDVVNNNITSMVEQAVAGKATVNSWTTNSHTLTTADGTTSESRCAVLELTDSGTALTGAGTVICPTNSKLYIVDNNTAQIVTIKTSAGTGIAVPVGKTMLVYCDGTNVVEGITHANSLSLGTSTVTVSSVLDQDNMSSDSATALATQQSIKAYVDSQVGTVDTLAEILANGNTTGGTDLAVSTGDDITFADSSKAIFGAGSDLQIYHDAAGSSYITESHATGSLFIKGTHLYLQNTAGQDALTLISGNAYLKSAGSTVLATTSSGIDVTGSTTVAKGSDSASILTLSGSSAGRQLDFQSFTNDGSAGAGFDLDATSGQGAITLSTVGTQRVKVDSTGIDVTGDLSVAGNNINLTGTSAYFNLQDSDGPYYGKLIQSGAVTYLDNTNGAAGSINFRTNASNTRALINNNGDFLWYNDAATQKMTWDASTARLGIGTSAPTFALDVEGTENNLAEFKTTHVGGNSRINFKNASYSAGLSIGLNNDGAFTFYNSTTAKTVFKVENDSDFIWNNSSGTEKMRWDASAAALGIGTGNPGNLLEVSGSAPIVEINATAGSPELQFSDGGTDEFSIQYDTGANALKFVEGGVGAHLTIKDGGNVGIGVTPEAWTLFDVLQLGDGGSIASVNDSSKTLRLGSNQYYDGAWKRVATGVTTSYVQYNGGHIWNSTASGTLDVAFTETERMRIDASGNLLVGKDAVTLNTEGHALTPTYARFTRSGGAPVQFNRTSNDGEIAMFYQAGSLVGNIGAASGQFYVGNEAGSLDTGILFGESGTTARAILPCRAEGTEVDGALDIGRPTARWKDAHFSGTVNADELTVEGAGVGGTYITSSSGSAVGDIKIEHIIDSSRSINTINSESGSGSTIDLAFATGGTQRVKVDSTGIDVSGATDTTVRVEATSGNDASLFLTEAGTGNVGAQLVYDGGDNNLYLKVGNNSNTNRLSVSRDTGDIIFYNDSGTEKMRWDASAASLGIGISLPQTALDVNGNATIGDGGTNGVINFNNTANGYLQVGGTTALIMEADGDLIAKQLTIGAGHSADVPLILESSDQGCYVSFEDSTSSGAHNFGVLGDQYRWYVNGAKSLTLDGTTMNFSTANPIIASSASSSQLLFRAEDSSGTARELRWDAANNANGALRPNLDSVVELGLTNKRYKRLYMDKSVGGIVFSDTSGQAASAANTLNDYEEGTFSVTTYGDATGAFSGLNTQYYTKVGNLVTVFIAFRVGTNFTSDKISNLPFVCNHPSMASSYINAGSAITSRDNTIGIDLYNGASYIRFHDNHNTSDAHTPNTLEDYYRISFSYRTDS
jgi:hypothetical protein